MAEVTPPTMCTNSLGQIGTFGDEQYDRQVTINRKRYIIYRSIQSMVYSILPLQTPSQTLQNNHKGLGCSLIT